MIGSTSSAVTRPARRRRPLAATAVVLSGVLATAGTADAAAASTPTAPPPITILTQGANNHDGDIFIAPTGDQTTYANGPEIIDNHGNVIWFHAVPAGLTASDFRTQFYDGQPVLTWWQGTGLGGLSSGTDYIYNDHYQQIATVNAGNGLSADGHEFLITPWNTALILAYTTATANLTSIGGPADQTVIDGIVQEINIRTGQVLFQWDSADHVPYSASETPLPASPSTPWDWFHINAVHLAWNGSLLIDARDTWATYDVSLPAGHVNWVLGGKDGTFTENAAPGQTLDTADEIFAWQHDPEQVGPDTFTWFDDEASPTELAYSRTVTVRVDFQNRTATLVSSDNQPAGLSATAEGNAQTALNGDQFVGWGTLPYISEFSPSGQLAFNAEFPAGVNTYRAYRLPWPVPGHGDPGGS
jgi:Arylsulfotransferase (ASST)